MTRLGFFLLVVCLMFSRLSIPTAHAGLPELPIRCYEKTQVAATIAGFADTTLVVEDTYGNVLYGFDTADCSEVWSIERHGQQLMYAQIAGKIVFAQFFDEPSAQLDSDDSDAFYTLPGKIMAIDTSSGDILWERESRAGYAVVSRQLRKPWFWTARANWKFSGRQMACCCGAMNQWRRVGFSVHRRFTTAR